MNVLLLILFGIAAIALIVFIIRRNLADKKEFEEKIKKDYRKPRDEEGDIDVEDRMH